MTPAFRTATIVSATSGLAPEYPIASDRARSTIIARTTSRSTGSPMPAACERIRARCSSSRRSAGIGVVASDPNPVETPYVGSAEAANRSTIAALSPIASRESSMSSTWASSRATATTSASVSPPALNSIIPIHPVARSSGTRADYSTPGPQTASAPTELLVPQVVFTTKTEQSALSSTGFASKRRANSAACFTASLAVSEPSVPTATVVITG